MEIKAGRQVDPCSTQMTKTGAWRTFVPVVDHEKCIKCSLCEIYCPEGCIHQVRGPIHTRPGLLQGLQRLRA